MIYFIEGKVIASSGNVKVYEYNNDLYLERGPGHYVWARASELKAYEDQIGDSPVGDCLELGLGLGVSAKYILSKQGVTSLTTIEKNHDVIETFLQLNPDGLPNHYIVEGDGFDFLKDTDKTFDFIFFDFYSLIDEDTLPEIVLAAKLAKRILTPGGTLTAWFDISTPEEFVDPFFKAIYDL